MTKLILSGLLLFFTATTFSKHLEPKKTRQFITFTENKGQVSDQHNNSRPDVLFSGCTSNMVYHLRNNGISYQLNRIDTWKEEKDLKTNGKRLVEDKITIGRLDMNWLGANKLFTLDMDEALEGYTNYYRDVCPSGALKAKTYAGVTYRDIYDGIDLHYYEKDSTLKYDYIISPHSDHRQIKIEILGAQKIELQANGSLLITTPLGVISEGTPKAFQGGRAIPCNWSIDNNVLSFEMVNYDSALPIVIDPPVRVWGTYYGGANGDFGSSCSVDALSNVYLIGQTNSIGGTVIATLGSYQSTMPGWSSGFIAKFDPNGARIWGTYYGGDYAVLSSSCVDNNNNLYVTGTVYASAAHPTQGSHQSTFGGGTDVFLTKFDSNGMRVWCTYYGGIGDEFGSTCAADKNNNVFLVGTASVTTNSVIATMGSHQDSHGGGNSDAFLVQFNSNGVRLWGTFYGGSGDDSGSNCATDSVGNVYLTGVTSTSTTISIVTANGYQTTHSGLKDAYLVKFDSNGMRVWGTYYGGFGDDSGQSCCTDRNGDIYLIGSSSSSSSVMTTPGCHESSVTDMYLAKFGSNGTRIWATFYGSPTMGSSLMSCCTDQNNNIYISGMTSVFTGTTIATPNGFQSFYSGGSDAFLAQFNSSGVRQWGTYYGDLNEDVGVSCVADRNGNVYMGGYSSWGSSAGSNNGHQPFMAGGWYDAFLVKMIDCSAFAVSITTDPTTVCYGDTVTVTGVGAATYTWNTGSNSQTLTANSVSNTLTYTLMGTNLLCPNTATGLFTIPVYSLPIVSVNSSSICAGSIFTISPSGAVSYTVFNSNFTVSPVSSINYSVMGTSAYGCTSASPAISSVTVFALPAVSVNGGTICSGEIFTITPLGAGNYTFSGGTSTVSPASTSSYSITGVNANGCISLPAVCTVTVYALPVVYVNSGTICSGEIFTITPSGAVTYTFSSGSNTVNPMVTSNYQVSGTNVQGCVSSAPASNTVSVYPIMNLNIITPSQTICAGESVSLVAIGANSYSWNEGTLKDSLVIAPIQTTTYSVIGTDIYNCENSLSYIQIVDLCVGIEQVNHTPGLTIYPNPATEFLTLSSYYNDTLPYSVFDVMGREFIHGTFIRKQTLSIADLINGAYVIAITIEGRTLFYKFLVNR